MPFVRRLHRRIDELQYQLTQVQAVPELYLPAESRHPETTASFRSFLRLLEPHDVIGALKRRFGGEYDGGYIMLDDLAPSRTALSLGIGPEVSWDVDMARHGLHVIQFDHTVDRPPRDHPQFDFHRARVVGRRQSTEDMTLFEILARPEFTAEKDFIAEMDIEGCEWDVLAQTESAALARIRQLAIEFHDVRRFVEPEWRETALTALNNLMTTHVCIHIHGNNWAPFTVIGGIPFPSVFEASFARRADHTFVPSRAAFPTDIDRPCNPKVSDLYLGCWNY
jgi:hypothetical protein